MYTLLYTLRLKQARYVCVCIPRSKSVCTTHFGVATAKTSTLYTYVYLVLKAYARRTSPRLKQVAIYVCIPRSKSVCTKKFMHINTSYILLKRENTNLGFFRFVYSFVSSTSFDNQTEWNFPFN